MDKSNTAMEDLKRDVAKCNALINECMSFLMEASRKMSDFRGKFDGQPVIAGRVDSAMRVVKAACGQLDALRPRIFMLEEPESFTVVNERIKKSVRRGGK